MILALFINNSLLSSIPETLGLLLFGVSLIAAAVGLRRIIDLEKKKTERGADNLEKLAGTKEN